MRSLALPLIAVVALAGCMSDGGNDVSSRAAPPQTLTLDNWRSYLNTPGCIRPPSAGGNVQAAFNLAAEANRTRRCVQFDGPAYSANVIIASLARDVRVSDPSARTFFMHYATHQETGERSYTANIILYTQAGLMWCWMAHNARFHDKPDGWTALSLNDIRRDCQ